MGRTPFKLKSQGSSFKNMGSSPAKEWDPFGIKKRRKEKQFFEGISETEQKIETRENPTGTITDADKSTAWKNIRKDYKGAVDKNSEEIQALINKQAQRLANARAKTK